ncbi:MAG: peptidase, partial [Massilia sp.]|nr:peptidase [Massilia sp.]
LDLLVYPTDSLAVTRFVTIDEHNQYFQMIRSTWARQLKSVFEGIADPVWDAAPDATDNVLSSASGHSAPVRVPLPADLAGVSGPAAPLQSLAEEQANGEQH